MEFFKEDGEKDTSRRMRGVVLHNILSRVSVPEDLEKSVQRAVLEGEVSEEESFDVMTILEGALKEGAARGWFPLNRSAVMNEVSLMDVGGREFRPDRVLLIDGKVTVIDYKFGEHQKKYERQVRQYSELWRRMGYAEINAFLWYVETGEIVEVL